MKKPIPGKAQIIWGIVLFIIPFFGSGSVALNPNTGEPEYMPVEWIRWVGIGLIVYGFVKNSRETKD